MSAAELEIGADQRAKQPEARLVRVALFGGFGIGNFGNDASLEARRPIFGRSARTPT